MAKGIVISFDSSMIATIDACCARLPEILAAIFRLSVSRLEESNVVMSRGSRLCSPRKFGLRLTRW